MVGRERDSVGRPTKKETKASDYKRREQWAKGVVKIMVKVKD